MKIIKCAISVCCLGLLVFTVIFSGAANIVSGNRIADDNRLLYSFKSIGSDDEPTSMTLIKTRDQLLGYYNDNNEKYGLDQTQPKEYYAIESFYTTMMLYEDSWFRNSYLALIVTHEENDLYYYRLNSMEYWFGNLDVVLYRDATKDDPNNNRVSWHVFLEIPKNDMIVSTSIKVVDKIR